MNIFRILQADVFTKSNLGTESQRASMIEYAQQIKQDSEQKQLNFSNKGCWRHEFDYPDISWLVEELRQLTNSAIETYANSDPLYNEKLKSYGPPVINYWTNINNTESKNALHDHRLHHYVAVYYLQGTDTGDIVWHNPMNLTESCHPHAPYTSRYALSPEDGQLILWPAWMPHETEVNKSNMQRINVAFNIRFQTPRYIGEN
jgi:uncharacterized protein (TIGR02466 family)